MLERSIKQVHFAVQTFLILFIERSVLTLRSETVPSYYYCFINTVDRLAFEDGWMQIL